jgi:hypothetical protein
MSFQIHLTSQKERLQTNYLIRKKIALIDSQRCNYLVEIRLLHKVGELEVNLVFAVNILCRSICVFLYKDDMQHFDKEGHAQITHAHLGPHKMIHLGYKDNA